MGAALGGAGSAAADLAYSAHGTWSIEHGAFILRRETKFCSMFNDILKRLLN